MSECNKFYFKQTKNKIKSRKTRKPTKINGDYEILVNRPQLSSNKEREIYDVIDSTIVY